jgi:hypothetical protein
VVAVDDVAAQPALGDQLGSGQLPRRRAEGVPASRRPAARGWRRARRPGPGGQRGSRGCLLSWCRIRGAAAVVTVDDGLDAGGLGRGAVPQRRRGQRVRRRSRQAGGVLALVGDVAVGARGWRRNCGTPTRRGRRRQEARRRARRRAWRPGRRRFPPATRRSSPRRGGCPGRRTPAAARRCGPR